MAYSFLGEPGSARGFEALCRESRIVGAAALPRDVCELVARYLPRHRWALLAREFMSGKKILYSAPVEERDLNGLQSTAEEEPLGEWRDSLYMESATLRYAKITPAEGGRGGKHSYSLVPLGVTSLAGAVFAAESRVNGSPLGSPFNVHGEEGQYLVGTTSSAALREYILRDGNRIVMTAYDFRYGLLCAYQCGKGFRVLDLNASQVHSMRFEPPEKTPTRTCGSVFLIDPNRVAGFYGGINESFTYDIREGKYRPCAIQFQMRLQRCDDSLTLEYSQYSARLARGRTEESCDDQFCIKRYDWRAERWQRWWSIESVPVYYDTEEGRTYWG